jgi:hypothetical protein
VEARTSFFEDVTRLLDAGYSHRMLSRGAGGSFIVKESGRIILEGWAGMIEVDPPRADEIKNRLKLELGLS